MISKLIEDNIDDIMQDIKDYILATYGEHYRGEGAIQEIDVQEARGSLITTSRDNASKYLSRYGKKAGYNEKDIMKSLHYGIIIYAKNHFKPDA